MDRNDTDGGEEKTIILSDKWAVKRRLAELNLPLKGLLHVVNIALHEGRTATPYHCANAAGTFAYHYGTWALRNEFVGNKWAVDRTNGVEAIWDKAEKVRVVFANVDVACDRDRLPRPRSPKGLGSELVCTGNLFGDLPHFAPRKAKGEGTYYLMVDPDGACELSMPVVKKGTFSSYIERIYLKGGSGFDGEKITLPDDNDDAVEAFDPLVVRK